MSTKVIIIIVIVIIVIISLIYFLGKRAGKRNAEGPQVDYPKGGSGIPAGWNPVPIAKELHDVMDGLFTSASDKEVAWQKLFDLPTDDMIVAVYNAYNQLYFGEGDGTLTDWIRDENYSNVAFGVKQDLLDKLQRLNLP